MLVAPVRPLSRELDGGFVRLGAGVAEECAAHPRTLDQLAREETRRLVVVEIARVRERTRLRRNRVRDRRMRVTERADGEAADKIEITLPALVDKLAAFARNDRERRASVRIEQRHVR